ncbi:MAG TPA: hypothetical protein GX731_00990, partial [Clostridiales bacterium]|nr:hypothetical protein [Clostridiales bacterium]
YAKRVDEDLLIYETIVSNIYEFLDGTIDRARLREDGYLANYNETVLKSVLTEINRKTRKSNGIYIAFDPQYTGRTEGIWVAIDPEGKEQYSMAAEVSGKDENDPEVAWYFNAVRSGEGSWSDLYTNDANVSVMSYSMPIIIDNNFLGVIGIDLSLQELIEDIESITLYDTGYAFMLNEEHDYIIHPTLNQESNLRNVSNGAYNFIADAIESEGTGLVDTDFDNDEKIMVFAKLHDGKTIILSAPRKEILKDMYATVYIILGVLAAGILFAIFISFYVGAKIGRPIVLVTQILEKTSRLDLTEIEETKAIKALENRKDEAGFIFKATMILRKEIREIIEAIEGTTNNIVNNTGNLTLAAGETSLSINEVAKSVEELAEATMEQAGEAERSSHKLNRLSDEIKGAVEDGAVVVESSAKAQAINQDGERSVNSMVEKFMIVKQTSQVLGDNIDSLQLQSQSIGNILSTIMNISEQTNLLALNAAIEAARAGEAGRGFAVVADEIRTLSADTGHATQNIEKILNTIQSEVENTKDNMGVSESALKDADYSLVGSREAFRQISEAIFVTIDAIGELEQKLQMIDMDKEVVIQGIESISAITEEVAASAEELSASTEEQAATMETISHNTDNLAQIIQKLESLVNRFTL